MWSTANSAVAVLVAWSPSTLGDKLLAGDVLSANDVVAHVKSQRRRRRGERMVGGRGKAARQCQRLSVLWYACVCSRRNLGKEMGIGREWETRGGNAKSGGGEGGREGLRIYKQGGNKDWGLGGGRAKSGKPGSWCHGDVMGIVVKPGAFPSPLFCWPAVLLFPSLFMPFSFLCFCSFLIFVSLSGFRVLTLALVLGSIFARLGRRPCPAVTRRMDRRN